MEYLMHDYRALMLKIEQEKKIECIPMHKLIWMHVKFMIIYVYKNCRARTLKTFHSIIYSTIDFLLTFNEAWKKYFFSLFFLVLFFFQPFFFIPVFSALPLSSIITFVLFFERQLLIIYCLLECLWNKSFFLFCFVVTCLTDFFLMFFLSCFLSLNVYLLLLSLFFVILVGLF